MSSSELAETPTPPDETTVGSVFVSNYPPFSFWHPDQRPRFEEALRSAPIPGVPLGLYLHIPFCRKRCKFCYFKVYTDKNSEQVGRYSNALVRELELYSEAKAISGRRLKFVYFGGGTPSYLSVRQLTDLVERLKHAIAWEGVEEIAFECEPGTLSRPKLETLREIGVTRLSLGIENFDDRILQINGRAHVTKEIFRVWPWIQEIGFDQVNVDLIAGMLGETWDSWRHSVQQAIDLAPDSVTTYQMELPFNTRFSKRLFEGSLQEPLADWPTKRAWQDYAIEQLLAAGYQISSAYTMVKNAHDCRFVYRDAVWYGADMIGVGVSAFSHLNGVHYQNTPSWAAYLSAVERDTLPVERALATDHEQRLIRELILQLKLGRLELGYFREKFQIDPLDRFKTAFEKLQGRGMLTVDGDRVELCRKGLLQIDSLLPEFYDEEHRNARYT